MWIGKSWSHFSRVEHLCDSGVPRVNCHQETPAEAHALVDVIDVVMQQDCKYDIVQDFPFSLGDPFS